MTKVLSSGFEDVGAPAKQCKTCPSIVPDCSQCKEDEICNLIPQTCDECPSVKCIPSSSSSKSTPIGGIVGAAVGGAVLVGLIIIGLLFYKFVYRKKHPFGLKEDEGIGMEYYGQGSKDGTDYAISNIDSFEGEHSMADGGASKRDEGQEKALVRPTYTNRRISSYESFTRPHRKPYMGRGRTTRGRQRRNQPKMGVYADSNSKSRLSVTTSMSTSNASNILPIAYIPGVTVRPTKNNTRSIYSNETSSVFSDWNTLEDASIIGDVTRSQVRPGVVSEYSQTGTGETMTAIRAQPKLVNFDMIEEEDEDITDDDMSFGGKLYDNVGIANQAFAPNVFANHVRLETNQAQAGTASSAQRTRLIEDEAYSDSDVDSDIGEINRATSVKRPQIDRNISTDREVLLDFPEEDAPNTHEQLPFDDQIGSTPERDSLLNDESPFKAQ